MNNNIFKFPLDPRTHFGFDDKVECLPDNGGQLQLLVSNGGGSG